MHVSLPEMTAELILRRSISLCRSQQPQLVPGTGQAKHGGTVVCETLRTKLIHILSMDSLRK